MISRNLVLILGLCSTMGLSKTDLSNPCKGRDLEFVNDHTSCSNYFSCVDGIAFPKVRCDIFSLI